MSIEEQIKEMQDAFIAIQQPRPDFVLDRFVIRQHDTEPQQYAQCVLELQAKYDAIRRAKLTRQKLEIEIEQLVAKDTPLDTIDADMKRIDLEEQDRALLGAMREFQVLYQIWKSFPHRYTRDELNAAQEEYWVKRLTRQANQDLQATGRVSQSNADALRMIGRSALPVLDHVRETERKYLDVGDCKILMAVPTEKKAVDGLPCVEQIVIPSGVQVKYYNVWGRSTAEAYNDAVMVCLEDQADYLFTVEDDTFPPSDALIRLLNHSVDIVGAWYPKRTATLEGTPIIVNDGKRQALSPDGAVHKVYTLPMGCSLFRAEVFLKTVHPWFVTTEHLTQDSFFSQKAREAGYTLWCDTSIRCKHIDRETGVVYE